MVRLIGATSYGLAAAAFLLLAVLLGTSWRGKLQGALLALAAAVAAAWATKLSYDFAVELASPYWWSVLETLRSAAWFTFLAQLLASPQARIGKPSPALVWFPRTLILLCLGLLFTSAVAPWLPVAHAEAQFVTDILGRVLLAIAGMALVEFVYRNARPDQRWSIKYLCLGLGAMFAYDFYLYSDAMLFKKIDAEVFAARGIVNALVVPFLAVSAARNPNWSVEIAVSRQVIFHSATLLAAGVYLLLMAAAGYYIRFFGGSWGGVLQATFMFGALLLLVAMLSSGTLRARIRVFLSKHFFTYRFDYREEWLRFTRTLSEGEPGVHLRERSIEAVAQLVESPGGALWLKQDDGGFQRAAQWNMPRASGMEPAGSGFVQFLEGKQWVIDISEYQAVPEKYQALALPAWLTAIPGAALVVPLVLHERLLGFVVLAQMRSGIPLNWEVLDLLKTAGAQAASYLAQLEAAKALLVARQFESFNRMSAFVVHDLKNLVSQLSLLLSNVQKHRNNPAFLDDMIETVENSVEKMQRLLTQLRSGSPAPAGESVIELEAMLRRVVLARESFVPAPLLEVEAADLALRADRERLERIVGHLIQNAIEATPPDGSVTVRLKRERAEALIEVADTGRGMSREFLREALFQPFETTKAGGMGIGTFESREYVRELGGQIEVESEEGRGSVFRIRLPLAAPKAVQGNVVALRGI